ncbi:hypothetical protein LSAT2_017218, partial [Lamellibrachia satsuma]
NNAALAKELERNVSSAEDIHNPSTCIIDGMNLVQKMNVNKSSAQLAESLMGSSTTMQYRNTSGGPNILQWRKFLCSSCNKSSLIKFILEQCKLPNCKENVHYKSLYVTCEEVC